MSEDVISDMTAFTPVMPDRDALLYAAGKAAARQWSGWKWLTVGLLASNLCTLSVFLWPQPAVAPWAPAAELPSVVEPSEPYLPDPSSYIALQHRWDAPTRPAVAGESPMLPSAPLTPRSLSDPRLK